MADDGFDISNLIPGPGYQAGNSQGYNGMKLATANNIAPPADAPSTDQLAQRMQLQFGGTFGALVKADGIDARQHGLNPNVQAWVGREQTTLALNVAGALGSDPTISQDTIAKTIGTLDTAAQTESAPIPFLRPGI